MFWEVGLNIQKDSGLRGWEIENTFTALRLEVFLATNFHFRTQSRTVQTLVSDIIGGGELHRRRVETYVDYSFILVSNEESVHSLFGVFV